MATPEGVPARCPSPVDMVVKKRMGAEGGALTALKSFIIRRQSVARTDNTMAEEKQQKAIKLPDKRTVNTSRNIKSS